MDRRRIAVSGVVQGVGFRPFVFALANRFGLCGFVRNETSGVLIEVEGEAPSLDRFLAELTERPPPLARIARVDWSRRRPTGDATFRIEASAADPAGAIFISPDVAACDDCVRELFDPADRRYRYPFLNCTNCGPRLTIVCAVPYDRERTTMAGFPMCPACRAEYEDPADRRFHAQPTACPACGPRLQAFDARGDALAVDDPLALAVEALRGEQIVAVKGLGGYHLACLATSERAVAELRRRKQREEKPLAVMVRDLAQARAISVLSDEEERLLADPRRPILLVRRRAEAILAGALAPGNPYLGVMLPYTPLHHLLLNDLHGAPVVMTSGNVSDEPIAYRDDAARERLAGIADLILANDRPIHIRCDDSVTRVVAGAEQPMRRARGEAPRPLDLPVTCRRPILALGGQLKATFALGRGRHAFVGHHIGDLDHYEAYRAYVEAVAHYERLFALRPEVVVHDLHPDYASTRYARERGGSEPRLAVQHHHAHVASCLADNGLDEPVIGLAFDGSGYGTDGTIWGGEFLVGDFRAVRRGAHLRYVGMPGGEQAIRAPWRMAAAYLADAGESCGVLENRVPPPALAIALRQVERGLNCPRTSSMGRLFDGVAVLAGLRTEVRFEGQAAMELEWHAADSGADGHYGYTICEGEACLLIDTRALIADVAEEARKGREPVVIARRFHSTLVEIGVDVCSRLREETGLATVALSGGVFLNVLLTTELSARLEQAGFRVLRHRRVPPNDGGLSLGQLAVAAALDTGDRSLSP